MGLAREIARTAERLGSALEAEVWASQMLGVFWRGRYELPFHEGVRIDAALEYGEPLLPELGRMSGAGAAIATMAIAALEDGELGQQARELLDTAGMWARLPAWAGDIGESQIIDAAVMRDRIFDDARNVFLEARHADGQVLAVGVLIDNNLGGMAKDVLLTDSIDSVEATIRAHPGGGDGAGGELMLERVTPGVAAGLISEAIRQTDMTWDPPVGDDYWAGRALALLRADQTPSVVMPEKRDEMPQARREALHAEFLASPEGAGIAPDSDEAWIVQLAIDFTAGYLADDPLRWSPSLAELFMLDWVPRKVLTTDAMIRLLPRVLQAWVRFVGRRRELPAGAIALTCQAIDEFAPEMAELSSDPDLGGPSKQFLVAARDAGVDIEDVQALETFIAGWNARSGLEEGVADIGVALGGAHAEPGEGLEGQVLQLKITLSRITKPPIWRRLRLLAETPLDELHQIIQVAFGWENNHLHVFEMDQLEFGPVEPELELDFEDESQFTLGELARLGDRIRYTYDFGDGWQHEIRVEKALEHDPGIAHPVLVTGRGACPPEDCGGVWGYEQLKEVLADPDADEHEAAREWLGLAASEAFDPKAVDLDAIRHRLARLQRRQ